MTYKSSSSCIDYHKLFVFDRRSFHTFFFLVHTLHQVNISSSFFLYYFYQTTPFHQYDDDNNNDDGDYVVLSLLFFSMYMHIVYGVQSCMTNFCSNFSYETQRENKSTSVSPQRERESKRKKN